MKALGSLAHELFIKSHVLHRFSLFSCLPENTGHSFNAGDGELRTAGAGAPVPVAAVAMAARCSAKPALESIVGTQILRQTTVTAETTQLSGGSFGCNS